MLVFCLLNVQTYADKFHVHSIEEANSVGKPGDTIYIAAGTYKTTLRPFQSGKSGEYITYRPVSGQVILTALDCGADLRSRSWICIDGLRFTDTNGPWINMQESSEHNIIQNCFMEGATTWAGITMKGASYNRILNNYMRATCPCTEKCLGQNRGGPHDLIYLIDSHHNLFEKNEMYDGIHDNIDIQDHRDGSSNFNIIRNNLFSNKWHANIDVWGIEYLLVENNMVLDGGEEHLTNYCSRSERDINAERHKHKGIHINTQFSIVRNNVVINNGRGIVIESAASGKKYPWKCNAVENRIYNNTVVGNQYGIIHNSKDPSVDNIVLNNILFQNKLYEISIFDGDGTSSTNRFVSNSIFGANEQYSFKDTRFDNLALDNPGFVNETERNFHLKDDSPAIDAGAWLTFTVGSGKKSKTLKVDDARFFTDGWDIIEGDYIQLEGQAVIAQIQYVDYETNTLTLSRKMKWADGTGIGLSYKGQKPDLGAFERNN